MHRQGTAVPQRCMQLRHSSTAAALKLKPRNWAAPQQSGWSVRQDGPSTSAQADPAVRFSRPAPQGSDHLGPSGHISRTSAEGPSKWARPAQSAPRYSPLPSSSNSRQSSLQSTQQYSPPGSPNASRTRILPGNSKWDQPRTAPTPSHSQRSSLFRTSDSPGRLLPFSPPQETTTCSSDLPPSTSTARSIPPRQNELSRASVISPPRRPIEHHSRDLQVEPPLQNRSPQPGNTHTRQSDRSQATSSSEERHYTPDVEEAAGKYRSRPQKPRGRGSLLTELDRRATLPQRNEPSSFITPRPKKVHALVERQVSPDVYIPSVVSVGALAQLLNVKLAHLQRQMRRSGMAEEASYDHVLTADYAVLLAEEFGRNPIVNDDMAFNIYPAPAHPNPSTLPARPPIITIMGHVDHGKTTLLDSLRSSSVAKNEAGGITQHIGAFSVPVPSNAANKAGPQSITFLDTPGHAAFSAMRARGATVTDIIVLVVAADDGVMPQTREVINLIKQDEGKVGVLVAVNKMDKPGVDVDKVYRALMSEGIEVEPLGGDVPVVPVSGLTGQGLPELVETLSAMAELQEMRAEQDGPVHGCIIESKVQKGLGPVATVLVTRGSLKTGTHLISGVSQAKVRVMNDCLGKPIKVARPGAAVTISGWKSLPAAGDQVLQGSESDIKKAIVNRERKAAIDASLVDVLAINNSRREERERRELEIKLAQMGASQQPSTKTSTAGHKQLNLIIKSDVSGSAEAVENALAGIGNHLAMTNVISSTVGELAESDVMLAKTSGADLVAFSVPVPRSIQHLANEIGVNIISSSIIYRLIESVTEGVIKLLPVTTQTKVTGEAEVLALFDITMKGSTKQVGGCRVNSGLVERNKGAHVLREGKIVHTSTIETLKHHKQDVMEMRKGTECGLTLADFGTLKPGDIIQIFETIEIPGVL